MNDGHRRAHPDPRVQADKASPHHVGDDLAAYALTALDSHDHARVAAHLHVCPRCRLMSNDVQAVVGQLAFASPPRRAPVDLRAHLLARAASMPQDSYVPAPEAVAQAATAAVGSVRGVNGRWSGLHRPRGLGISTALPWLVAASLGLGWLFSAHPQSGQPTFAFASVEGPGGVRGKLAMLSSTRGAALALTHLRSLGPGKRYVCWLESGGQMERACIFRISSGDDASVAVHSRLPMGTYSRLTISIESTPLPSRPTGTLLAFASLR